MELSTSEEIVYAAEIAIGEIATDDHNADGVALANVALNGGREPAAAIALLQRAQLELARQNTADAKVAIAANIASAHLLYEATVKADIDEFNDFLFGPAGILKDIPFFANGGVVSP